MSGAPEKEVPVEEGGEAAVPIDTESATPGLRREKSSLEQRQDEAQEEALKAPYNPWMDPAGFPDGGLRAWLTVAGASACFFVSWG